MLTENKKIIRETLKNKNGILMSKWMNNKIELFEKIKTTINTTGVKSGKQNASLSKEYQLRHPNENRFIKDQENSI